MTRVLVTAFVGSDNLGDEAIFEALVRTLESLGDVEVVAFTPNPNRRYGSGRVRLLQRRGLGDLEREIRAADLVVCGGGGLIQDQTSVYNLAAHVHPLVIAHALGRPYLFYAVGVTPLANELFSVEREVQTWEIDPEADSVSPEHLKKLFVNQRGHTPSEYLIKSLGFLQSIERSVPDILRCFYSAFRN